MLAAHALGALDPDERRALALHLATCAECGAELEGWQETAAALAYSAPLAEPSANLRARILAGARAHSQTSNSRTGGDGEDGSLGPSAPREASQASTSSTTSETSAPTSTKVLPFAPPAKRRWSAPSVFGALAASLVFAALLVSLLVLWQRNNRMQAELSSLSNRLNETQGELARAREERAPPGSPEPQAAMLAGTKVAPRAHAMLAFDRQSGRAMLIAYDLPPAPEGKAYQLWFIAGERIMPGGVFTPDGRGHAELRDLMPAEGRTAASATFAVTLEPAGGVSKPSGAQYLLGQTS